LNSRLDSFRSGGKTGYRHPHLVSFGTLTLPIVNWSKSIEEKKQRDVQKNPCTKVLKLIYEALILDSWCSNAFCVCMLNSMLIVILLFLLCICCYATYEWFLVECLKSERESKKWASIVSLSEQEFLQGVQWNVRKECVDGFKVFISEISGRITLFWFSRNWKFSTGAVQGVRGPSIFSELTTW
jgi:hypothetical protein